MHVVSLGITTKRVLIFGMTLTGISIGLIWLTMHLIFVIIAFVGMLIAAGALMLDDND